MVKKLCSKFVSVHKWPFGSNFSLLSKCYPRDISYMPVVKFIERLDLEKKTSFLDKHKLGLRMGGGNAVEEIN